MKKRVLATTFALALSLSLAVPVASAADTPSVEFNVKNSEALLLSEPSFQVRNWDLYSEEISVTKLPEESFSPEFVYRLPLGVSLRLATGGVDDSFYISAWSDSDGDGVYDRRVNEIEYSVLDEETLGVTSLLFPDSHTGPLMMDQEYVTYLDNWPVAGHNNVDFTVTDPQSGNNAQISSAYLAKTFGSDTLIELSYVVSVDPVEYFTYYFFLTDEKIDPADLDKDNVSLSNAGAVVSAWAVDTINAAETANLVPDYLWGADLTQNATRSDFAGASVKLYEAMSGQSAPDVTQVDPFEDASDIIIRQAYALGFINGVGEGKFAPNAPLTREQAAVILARVYEKVHDSIPSSGSTSFADDASISSWSKDAVAFMSGKGIVGGVGNNRFDPQGNTTGEQALAIALRMFQNLK